MKKLFFILIFCLNFCYVQVLLACSKDNNIPEIHLYSSYGKLTYDNSKNNAQITEIASKYGILEKGVFASGLSTIDINLDIVLKTSGEEQADKNICVYPKNIDLTISFSSPIIYISNKLQPNSCEYNLVLLHEQTHQQINSSALDFFLPMFKIAANEIAKNLKPIKIQDKSKVDTASNQLTIEFNKKLTPLLKFFKKQILQEQLKLDNNENYKNESLICH